MKMILDNKYYLYNISFVILVLLETTGLNYYNPDNYAF